jgi:hypothetical protein
MHRKTSMLFLSIKFHKLHSNKGGSIHTLRQRIHRRCSRLPLDTQLHHAEAIQRSHPSSPKREAIQQRNSNCSSMPCSPSPTARSTHSGRHYLVVIVADKAQAGPQLRRVRVDQNQHQDWKENICSLLLASGHSTEHKQEPANIRRITINTVTTALHRHTAHHSHSKHTQQPDSQNTTDPRCRCPLPRPLLMNKNEKSVDKSDGRCNTAHQEYTASTATNAKR